MGGGWVRRQLKVGELHHQSLWRAESEQITANHKTKTTQAYGNPDEFAFCLGIFCRSQVMTSIYEDL